MQPQVQNKRKKGFTLIELMVVISIMGILAAVAVPNILGLVEKSKEKVDLMKLFYLRDALNRAMIENEGALYNSSYLSQGNAQTQKNRHDSLSTNLSAESGVALFVIEMKKTASVNIQAEHNDANKSVNMCRLIGSEGTWYEALLEAHFEGVAEIVQFRLDTKNNDGIGKDIEANGALHDSFTIKEDGGNYRTAPKSPMFMSRALNTGTSIDPNKNKNQGGSKTNYRVTMSVQWSGRNPDSHSVEVALLPNKGKMLSANGKGGAFLTDNGVCFSTYGDIGCADFGK